MPVDDKSLNSELSNDKSGMKNEKPATEGQINFVKSLLKQNRVSHENFMKDNNIDAMEDISVKLAQSAIQQYNVKKRGNKP